MKKHHSGRTVINVRYREIDRQTERETERHRQTDKKNESAFDSQECTPPYQFTRSLILSLISFLSTDFVVSAFGV